MNTLLEKITDLNDLVLRGKALEAFDKYYHDDVVMQENDNPPWARPLTANGKNRFSPPSPSSGAPTRSR
jgi:hypothetical protein